MTKYFFSDELYHYGRSKADGAPGPGTGNYPRPSHWGSRTSQIKDNRFSDKDRNNYLKIAMAVSDKNLLSTIGNTTTRAKQQNRYLKWARSKNERNRNKDRTKRGDLANKEILASKNEAKLYRKALKKTFDKMKEYSNKKVPDFFYNEDMITQVFNDSYNLAVIEPAWRRFDSAIKMAKNATSEDEDFANFTSNKSRMKRYGYSEDSTGESLDLGLTMEQMAYVDYLLAKGKV